MKALALTMLGCLDVSNRNQAWAEGPEYRHREIALFPNPLVSEKLQLKKFEIHENRDKIARLSLLMIIVEIQSKSICIL